MNKLTIAILVLVVVAGLGFVIFTSTREVEDKVVELPSSTVPEPSVSGTPLPEVANPQPNQQILSPLEVSGRAPGNWFFEASLPVKLFDADGEQIAISPAQAEGDWMTTEYVPFKTTLTFDSVTTATGTLVISKDNPSGLPENDWQFIVPVSFAQ